jgi:hypothetical protein
MVSKDNTLFRPTTGKRKEDPMEAQQREARLQLGERFLDEVLLVAIHKETLTHPKDVLALYEVFRMDNAGLGDDFELEHVYFIALERDLHNECLAEHSPEQFPIDAADVATAMGLLKILVSRA